MGYILIAVLAVLACVLSFAVYHAIRIKAAPPLPCTTQIDPSETNTAAEKLGAMVRIPCVSKAENEDR